MLQIADEIYFALENVFYYQRYENIHAQKFKHN